MWRQRAAFHASIRRGQPAFEATRCATTIALESDLIALGFEVDLQTDTPSIRRSRPEEITARATGAQTEAMTILAATEEPVVGGLFCPTIFGDLWTPEFFRRFGRLALPRSPTTTGMPKSTGPADSMRTRPSRRPSRLRASFGVSPMGA